MEKEFIAYEQALALKELGFDEPCFGYYVGLGDSKEDPFKLVQIQSEKEQFQWTDNVYHTPIYQQAFRWFREKYNLDKIIDNWTEQPMDGEIWDKAYQYYINGEAYHPYFKTHEEAELECIKKLIEIVKEK
jgi:hypothetical protein